MKKFNYSLLIFLAPLLVVIVLYLIVDPFLVIQKYDTYIDSGASAFIVSNKGYISTETFENNYPKENYNSYIFGNSRSIFYQVKDWKKHIGQNNNCYHFDASDESLFGLYKKILFVDSKKVKLDNVLLVLDSRLLNQDKAGEDYLFDVPPKLVNYQNVLSFHFNFFRAFIRPRFFLGSIYFKITKKTPPLLENIFDTRKRSYDQISNEIQFDQLEKLINEDKYYNKERLSVFFKRNSIQQYSSKSIAKNQEEMLNEISKIFDKHQTNFKIIISPLYNQKKLNQEDFASLDQIFGEENVFDFSGINTFTNDYQNYYEASHYRPHIAREILDSIYLKQIK